MSTQHLPEVAPDASAVPQQVTLAEIEQIIEHIGARYITDLRMLSEEVRRYYEAQLTAKDEQIENLRQRLEAGERERAKLEAHMSDLKRYLAHMQTLSEELSQHLDSSHGEWTHEQSADGGTR